MVHACNLLYTHTHPPPPSLNCKSYYKRVDIIQHPGTEAWCLIDKHFTEINEAALNLAAYKVTIHRYNSKSALVQFRAFFFGSSMDIYSIKQLKVVRWLPINAVIPLTPILKAIPLPAQALCRFHTSDQKNPLARQKDYSFYQKCHSQVGQESLWIQQHCSTSSCEPGKSFIPSQSFSPANTSNFLLTTENES